MTDPLSATASELVAAWDVALAEESASASAWGAASVSGSEPELASASASAWVPG
jgi:hypothetical protein